MHNSDTDPHSGDPSREPLWNVSNLGVPVERIPPGSHMGVSRWDRGVGSNDLQRSTVGFTPEISRSRPDITLKKARSRTLPLRLIRKGVQLCARGPLNLRRSRGERNLRPNISKTSHLPRSTTRPIS